MASIIITGARPGVGRATAQAFIDAGWDVGLVGRREAPLTQTKGDSTALALPCDVTDEAAVDAAFGKALDTWGRIDVLFNNAGVSLKGAPIDELAVDDIRYLLDVNIMGAVIVARAAFGIMRKQDPQGGRIINNGSISAHVPRPSSIAYAASKAAVTGLTRGAALDGRPFNISVGPIDVGHVARAITEKMASGVLQADGSVRAEARMDMSSVAKTFMAMVNLPLDANIFQVTVMATGMPYVGRGSTIFF
mgnify:CR=1 FL=1